MISPSNDLKESVNRTAQAFDSNTWSFITLRLLKEIDGRVAFFPPNGHLTGHSVLKNKIELDSNMANKLANALDKWTCTRNEFEICILNCVEYLAGNSYSDL